jgi:hypothetical protein
MSDTCAIAAAIKGSMRHIKGSSHEKVEHNGIHEIFTIPGPGRLRVVATRYDRPRLYIVELFGYSIDDATRAALGAHKIMVGDGVIAVVLDEPLWHAVPGIVAAFLQFI